MRVLITGGNGDIAKGIKEVLNENNILVFAPTREQLDITVLGNVKRFMAATKPNVLINCAGYIEPASIKDSNEKNWVKHLEVNLIGAYYCSKYAIKNGCHTVINIGSTSAFEGRETWGAYCCSKAGIMSLTETLAREGYNSYAIHPARTATKMRKRLFPNEDVKALMNPRRIGEFVLKCLNHEFANGSHIIVKLDRYFVLPIRNCPK